MDTTKDNLSFQMLDENGDLKRGYSPRRMDWRTSQYDVPTTPDSGVRYQVRLLPDTLTSRLSTPGMHMLSDPHVGLVRKLFWASVFAASIAFTLWNISKQVIKYNRRDITTTITVVPENSQVFPSITFCPIPPIFNIPGPMDVEIGRLGYYQNHGNVTRLYHRNVKTLLGTCITFNPDGNITSLAWGKYSNAKFIFPVMWAAAISQFDVYIHTHIKNPASFLFLELPMRIDLEDYRETEIRVETSKTVHHEPELVGCTTVDGNNATYTKGSCIMSCFNIFASKNCHCGIFTVKGRNISACSLVNGTCEFNTSFMEAEDYSINFVEDFLIKGLTMSGCKRHCSNPCKETKYTVSRTLGRKSNTDLFVYFENLDSQYIETRGAYDIYQLICDIGGALSLLLGATFLTFLDAVDYCIMLLWDTNRRKDHHTKSQCNGTMKQ